MLTLIFHLVTVVALYINIWWYYRFSRSEKLRDEFLGKALQEIDQLKRENRNLDERIYRIRQLLEAIIQMVPKK